MEKNMENKEGEKSLTPAQIEHRTRAEIINQEQPEYDDVEISNNPNAPKSILNPAIMEQYDQAKEPSDEQIKLRDYKQRQMEEFTNNYSISQVIPSGWTTFFNVINTIFLTLALIIAFFVAFGLLFGLRIGLVPTTSMEPTIPAGSLVVLRPVDSIDNINRGDIISYQKGSNSYIHRVETITPASENSEALIVVVGDNPETAGQADYVPFRMVEGKMVLSIPVLGYVFMFIKDNIILTVAIILTLIIAMLLIRSVVERKHAKQEIERFLTLKAEYEQEAERKYMEQKRKEDEKAFKEIMRTTYGDEKGTDSISTTYPANATEVSSNQTPVIDANNLVNTYSYDQNGYTNPKNSGENAQNS